MLTNRIQSIVHQEFVVEFQFDDLHHRLFHHHVHYIKHPEFSIDWKRMINYEKEEELRDVYRDDISFHRSDWLEYRWDKFCNVFQDDHSIDVCVCQSKSLSICWWLGRVIRLEWYHLLRTYEFLGDWIQCIHWSSLLMIDFHGKSESQQEVRLVNRLRLLTYIGNCADNRLIFSENHHRLRTVIKYSTEDFSSINYFEKINKWLKKQRQSLFNWTNFQN